MAGMRTAMPFVSAGHIHRDHHHRAPALRDVRLQVARQRGGGLVPIPDHTAGAGFAASIVYYFKWIGTHPLSGAGSEGRTVAGGKGAPDTTNGPSERSWSGHGPVHPDRPGTKLPDGPVHRPAFALPSGNGRPDPVHPAGEFPVVLVLIVVALIFVGLGFLVRQAKEQMIDPLCRRGGLHFEPGAITIWASGRRAGHRVTEGAGVLLIVALLLTPFVLEVLRWTWRRYWSRYSR